MDYILQGSARLEGPAPGEAERVRIAAQLIKVADQAQLWAEQYERELAGILVLQSDVARKVAGALALRLLPAEQARLANARAVIPEAYDAYLKGTQLRQTAQGADAAERYFRLALEKDPILRGGLGGYRQSLEPARAGERHPSAGRSTRGESGGGQGPGVGRRRL